MILTIKQATEIAAHRGGLRLRASHFTADQLAEIASYSKGKGRLDIVVDGILTIAQMTNIASHGGGSVQFDLT